MSSDSRICIYFNYHQAERFYDKIDKYEKAAFCSTWFSKYVK